MKNIKNLLSKFFLFATILLSVIAVAGCKDNDNPDDGGNQNPPAEEIKVSIGKIENNTLKKGDSVELTVNVTGTTNKEYTWSISLPEILEIKNNKVSIKEDADFRVDKLVTVTATSVEDPNKSASVSFVAKAEAVEGSVGELTSKMIEALGNPSITVAGKLTDYYIDFNQSANNTTHEYAMKVMMEEGKWFGSWSIIANEEEYDTVSDYYVKGEQDGLKDDHGIVGHAMEKVYIDKDNKVAHTPIKNYMSIPAVWEAQHLWNHLGSLAIDKFSYDVENDVYAYSYDPTNVEQAYLMTYLSFCLTPMLSDTLDELYLIVKDGEIVELRAQTEKLYYGSDTREDADGVSYTTVVVKFSDVGTTTIQDPTPYELPDNASYLQKALETMSKAKNYTFKAVDKTTFAPSTDSGDYMTDSLTNKQPLTVKAKVRNNVSSVGTVGCFGKVTEDAILFANTDKYSYATDDKIYHTEYSGYKQNADNTYDVFGYDAKLDALKGTKKVKGNIFDTMPTFDFSANVFEFVGMSEKNHKVLYTFKLRETAITRDIAMEVSCYRYAKDALASASSTLTITVDKNGNLVSTSYPYDLVSGTYTGICTTEYSKVGTTELDADLFDGYVPRVVKKNWSDYEFTDYYYTHSTKQTEGTTAKADVVIKAIFGEEVFNYMVTPEAFLQVIGDNVFGPFFNWKENGSDADGNTIYMDYFSFTASSDKYDENYQITNYEEIIEEFTKILTEAGYTLSVKNTDTTGGETGRSDRFVTFIKGDSQIVIQNNHTRYFWIYFYKTGDWVLDR